MIALNLTATTNSQKRVLAYLKENASEALAEKINKGTPFTINIIQFFTQHIKCAIIKKHKKHEIAIVVYSRLNI